MRDGPLPKEPMDDVRKFEILSAGLGLDGIKNDIDDLKLQLKSLISELGNTNTVLNQVTSVLNQGQQVQSGSVTTQPTNQGMIPNNFMQIDPVTKMNLIATVADAFARVVTAWKGQANPDMDPMGQIGKQMITDLVRATVDDVQQRVYNIRKLPPPEVLQQAASKAIHTLQ